MASEKRKRKNENIYEREEDTILRNNKFHDKVHKKMYLWRIESSTTKEKTA